MKDNLKKIIILSVLFLLLSFFIKNEVFASSLYFYSPNSTVGIGEQFYVDLLINPEGREINGIEGSVSYSQDDLKFIRSEEGKSIINYWVEKPKQVDNVISFAGIIPNGFSGLIDPFNPNKKLPSIVIRLVFEGKNKNNTIISLLDSYATLNDGKGTIDNIPNSNFNIAIQNINNPFVYKTPNDSNPELSAYITRDPNLYNNRYTLIYEAKDSQTGIKEVLIKEGRRKWKKIESPYLLEDQSRHSIITLQATNYSDSSIALGIDRLPYKIFTPVSIAFFIVLFVLLLFIIKKIYEKHKKIHN